MASIFLLMAALTAVVVPAAQADEPAADPTAGITGPTTRIIGGGRVPTGGLPFTAALLYTDGALMFPDGGTRHGDFFCGATVLSPSWVLTAAHCIRDAYGDVPGSHPGPMGLDYIGPDDVEVLTGTTSLSEQGGGQRLPVAAIYKHPGYTGIDNDFDFALIRLAQPTTAPSISPIGPDEPRLEAAGTAATVAGWGLLADGKKPYDLQAVNVTVIDPAVCRSIYYDGRTSDIGEPTEFRSESMLCAGRLSGGIDSCQGDSGGPLIAYTGGSHRLIGVVSWGDGCAEPNLPGVYSRVSASRGWIDQTSRFGPFDADGVDFTVSQHRDIAGREPVKSELLKWTQAFRDQAAPSSLTLQLLDAPRWADYAPPIARLYRAAFLRNPDTDGFAYWLGPGRANRSLYGIADYFATSREFRERYGSLGAGGFVDTIYSNIFGRSPDARGRAHWVEKLESGTPRGAVLAQLSDSAEYRVRTAPEIQVLTTWFAMLRKVPTAAQITANVPLSRTRLVDDLRHSLQYADRFAG